MIKLPKTKIRNFEYNGFCGRMLKGYAKFKVISFSHWTRDPGIAVFRCSDEKLRLIPTFAFSDKYDEIRKMIPKQDLSNKVYFGAPTSSEGEADFLSLFK